MNTAPHHSALADEQASLWAARLEGSVLSAADRIALDAWLAADPAHRALLSAYCQFSADLEQQLPLLAGIRDELAESPTAAKTARSLPWLSRPLWAGAALLAVAVVAAVFLWPARPRNQFQNLATPVAHRETVTLADGTRVELNAQTALVVELTAEARRVRLAGGEAFFTVSPDPARPFFVETPAGAVRVTGTAFNVRTESMSDLEVTVFKGSVRVSPAAATVPTLLTAGGQLTVRAGGITSRVLSPRDLDNALAWRRGQVFFAGVRLDEALARYSRYHGRSLTAAPEVAGKTIGGLFSMDDLEGFLDGLEEIYRMRVTRDLNGTVLVNPSAQP